MFIKEIKKSNISSDKVFIYHRLIESYNTEKGPRHRNILNLGKLSIKKDLFKVLADRIEQILNGIKPMFNVDQEIEALANHYANVLINKKIKLIDNDKKNKNAEDLPDYETVDLKSITTSACRSIGAEHISYSMMKKLGLLDIFKEIGFSEDEIKYAVISIVGRLVHPGSENATFYWAKNKSSLEELLKDDFINLSRNKMYEIIDKLIDNKELIESKLRENEKNIFSLKEKIILYDLTNTYFEGDSQDNPKAKRGRSKEKRSDCPLLTLALVIDEHGFPKRSRILEGNVSEPKTLQTMVKDLIGDAELFEKPTILIDAGISSEENLTMLRDLGYDYLCVARNQPLTEDEISGADLNIIKEDANNRIEVKLFRRENEQILYCHSELKGKKEEAMKNQYETRFEEGMKSIESSIHKKKGVKQYGKVMERIGKLKGKLSQINMFYEITVEKDAKEKVTKIEWVHKNEEIKNEKFSGSYILRSSRMDLGEQELWELYTVLTNVENTFRTLKTDLNIRPVYHQKTGRCDGHIFITLLAYHIVNSVQTILKKSDIHYSWKKIRDMMSTMCRTSTLMKSKDGKNIVVRTTSNAEKEQEKLLRILKIKIDPIGTKTIRI